MKKGIIKRINSTIVYAVQSYNALIGTKPNLHVENEPNTLTDGAASSWVYFISFDSAMFDLAQ